ncbi:MAG: toxin HigB [Fimbriimonadaceae bacterium]|nr:toxin HigB [Fimbriimonadaceae bacterium]
MNFDFEAKDLLQLYLDESSALSKQFPPEVIDQFFMVMAEIMQATDERDLRLLKSRRFEKLQRGGGDHSLRLNRQFRLIVAKTSDPTGPKLLIRRIEDYH